MRQHANFSVKVKNSIELELTKYFTVEVLSKSHQVANFVGSSNIPASGGNLKIQFEVNTGNISSENHSVQYVLGLDKGDFDSIDIPEDGSTLTIPEGILSTEYRDVKLRVYKKDYVSGTTHLHQIFCELYSESRNLTSADQPGAYSVIIIGIPINVKPNSISTTREIEFRYTGGSIKATQEGSNISLSKGGTLSVTNVLKPITTVQTNSEFVVQ